MDGFLITLYAFITVISLFTYYIKNRYDYWKKRKIPYEEAQFLFGNFYTRRKANTGRYNLFKDMYDKYRGTIPFTGFFTFTTPSVLLLDLDLIRNVLIKDFNLFEDRGGRYYNEKSDPVSANLVTLGPEKWRPLRRKITPTFTSGKLKMMYPLMVGVAEELLHVIDEFAGKNSEIDTKDFLARFTTDAIGRCGFGIDCNSLSDPNAEFYRVGKKVSSLDQTCFHMLFIEALPKVAKFLNMRFYPLEISNFYMKLVNATVEHRKKNNRRRNDFMDMLIDLKNKQLNQLKNGEKGTGLTMDEVSTQAFSFFVAGFSTSSNIMNFSLYELAKNQSIQDNLRKEINDVLKKHGGDLTYEAIHEMSYLDMVISEALRMYSPFSNLRRIAKVAYPTHDPRFVIPKGAFISIPIHNIHNDPDIYPNPEVFDPERFTPEEVLKRHPMSWLGFGDGPRNCIGMRFAKTLVSVGLAMLVKTYKFSVTKNTPIPMKFKLRSRQLVPDKNIVLGVERVV